MLKSDCIKNEVSCMEELQKILDEIEKIYDTMLPSKEKHKKLERLWTSYYQILRREKKESCRGYQLYLLGENESFSIEARNKIPLVSIESLNAVLEKLERSEVLKEEDMKILLDQVVSYARSTIEGFGVSVEESSLNGFCEIGQALTIMPFEEKNFKVTKNTATSSFGYPWNHAFGTVTGVIQQENQIVEESYLIDITYLQFFSTTRCNEGRYDALEENTSLPTSPDPGYFLTTEKEKQFACELVEKGYIKLTDENARIYADGFRKASLLKEQRDQKLPEIDAKKQILETSIGSYAYDFSELECLDISSVFSKSQNKIGRQIK